jgi:hypothetical protein
MDEELDLIPNDEINEEYDRICRICKVKKKLEEFPFNGDPRGGKRYQCKECMREINRKWRKDKKLKIKV